MFIKLAKLGIGDPQAKWPVHVPLSWTHINAWQEDKTSDSYRIANDDKQLHPIPNVATTDPHMALEQSEPAPQR